MFGHEFAATRTSAAKICFRPEKIGRSSLFSQRFGSQLRRYMPNGRLPIYHTKFYSTSVESLIRSARPLCSKPNERTMDRTNIIHWKSSQVSFIGLLNHL